MSRFDKRRENRSRTLVQVSVLVVILFMTSVFALSHKINKGLVEAPPKIIIDYDGGFVLPPDVIDNPVPPTMAPIPIPPDDGDDPDDYKDNYIFEPEDFRIVKEPVPFIEFKGKEESIFPYVSVQEKPSMSASTRRKLSKYIYKNYPALATRSGVSGVVVLNFICSKEGRPTQVRIVKETPANMGFGKVAMAAIKQVTFKPGLQRDKPVAVRMKLPIRFSTR